MNKSRTSRSCKDLKWLRFLTKSTANVIQWFVVANNRDAVHCVHVQTGDIATCVSCCHHVAAFQDGYTIFNRTRSSFARTHFHDCEETIHWYEIRPRDFDLMRRNILRLWYLRSVGYYSLVKIVLLIYKIKYHCNICKIAHRCRFLVIVITFYFR